jgi:hypothetical protein
VRIGVHTAQYCELTLAMIGTQSVILITKGCKCTITGLSRQHVQMDTVRVKCVCTGDKSLGHASGHTSTNDRLLSDTVYSVYV